MRAQGVQSGVSAVCITRQVCICMRSFGCKGNFRAPHQDVPELV